jgi:hypothetical protein
MLFCSYQDGADKFADGWLLIAGTSSPASVTASNTAASSRITLQRALEARRDGVGGGPTGPVGDCRLGAWATCSVTGAAERSPLAGGGKLARQRELSRSSSRKSSA